MGAFAALPLAAQAIAGVGAGIIGGGIMSSMRDDPPPVINSLPQSQQIANRIPPINFASVMDELTGDQLEIIRGTDGSVNLGFRNTRGRVSLEDSPNINLPAVRQIRGRNIDERAVEVIALSQAMTRLGGAIEQMESTSPYLIEQNQDLINSYRTAVSGALDRGFDFKQQAIDQRLTKMGLANSSTAIGTQIALAREKANAYAEFELKNAQLAQDLKQQAIANLHQRGNQLNQQANTELNRFGVETSNQLQLREQDMRADLATQALEQQRAISQEQLVLDRNRQIEGRRMGMIEAGTNLFNQGNTHSIQARNVDNNAIGDANRAQYARYDMTSNPGGELLNTFAGSMAGIAGQSLGSRIFGGSGRQPVRGLPWLNQNSLNLFDQ
jgi:hypothetical protein